MTSLGAVYMNGMALGCLESQIQHHVSDSHMTDGCSLYG